MTGKEGRDKRHMDIHIQKETKAQKKVERNQQIEEAEKQQRWMNNTEKAENMRWYMRIRKKTVEESATTQYALI